MSDTPNLGLPLLQAAQAQKHVTVNESLVRLDALAHLRLASVSTSVPPAGPAEGACYGIPAGAVNAWDGHVGEIALFSNGGWVFIPPLRGWRGFVDDQGAMAVFDGAEWVLHALSLSDGGAITRQKILEFDHDITPGAVNYTSTVIEDRMVVFGVSVRVLNSITGTGLTSWEAGVDGGIARYGSGFGLTAGFAHTGPSGSPVAYWGGTPLRLDAVGGDFASGRVRIAIHGLTMAPPSV